MSTSFTPGQLRHGNQRVSQTSGRLPPEAWRLGAGRRDRTLFCGPAGGRLVSLTETYSPQRGCRNWREARLENLSGNPDSEFWVCEDVETGFGTRGTERKSFSFPSWQVVHWHVSPWQQDCLFIFSFSTVPQHPAQCLVSDLRPVRDCY